MKPPLQRRVRVPDQHCFLFGPRGTGKSTWLRQRFGEAVWIDLLEPSAFRSFEARPERLSEHLEAHLAAGPVVIDEIQRVPALLPVVHSLIESRPDLQFILTGSSARKLRSTGVDLLAVAPQCAGCTRSWRSSLTMPSSWAIACGWEWCQWSASREAPETLWRGTRRRSGGVPGDALAGYIDVYLRQEVQAEAMVRRIDSFTRFLEAMSFSQGSVINLSGVARECEVRRSTVGTFVEILEDLLVAGNLPVFTRRARRQMISHGKFYFFDCGVYRSLRPTGPLDRPEEIDGAALETLVYQHLRAWIDYSNAQDTLHFWRTRAGAEVDFVVHGPSGFWAIEVKKAGRIRPANLRSLRTFTQDYPEATPLFLYRGTERLRVGGITCVPVEEFLRALTPGSPLLS